jgi:hypothetical protein
MYALEDEAGQEEAGLEVGPVDEVGESKVDHFGLVRENYDREGALSASRHVLDVPAAGVDIDPRLLGELKLECPDRAVRLIAQEQVQPDKLFVQGLTCARLESHLQVLRFV